MVKRILLALLGLCFAQAAIAQTFPVPSDITTPFNQITPLYKTDGTVNATINSVTTPMPVGTGLTNIPIPSTTNRVLTNGPYNGSASPFCLTTFNGGSCFEAKFRTNVDFSHMAPDDPIRNARDPGKSHLHCFFGAGSTNAYSTFKTLRNHALNSTAAGTDANGTAYWYPCPIVLNPYGNGKNYAIKADFITVYYVGDPAQMRTAAHIPIGLRYVLGFDMDDQYAWLQTILNSANAAQGYTRYTMTNPGTGRFQTQATYNCTGATPLTVSYIVNADGSDPHAGTCASGAQYYIKITGPQCYDGTHLWSPGGYKHLIPSVWDTVANNWTCPYNYYRIPDLTLEITITQHGWTDRQRWALSSDIAYRAAKGLTAAQVPSGMTFHTDWMDGWDNAIRLIWENNCLGVEAQTPHECNNSQISSTQQLKGGGSGENGVSRTPQVDFAALSHALETDPGWMLIPPAWSGALTAHKVH